MQGSEVLYTAHTDREPPLTPGEDDSTVAPPYVAYSGSGKVNVSLQSNVIYHAVHTIYI